MSDELNNAKDAGEQLASHWWMVVPFVGATIELGRRALRSATKEEVKDMRDDLDDRIMKCHAGLRQDMTNLKDDMNRQADTIVKSVDSLSSTVASMTLEFIRRMPRHDNEDSDR